jgi:transcriptional regulator with XRE-family HTH domain
MGKYQRLISRMAGSVDYWAQAAMRRFVLDIDRRMKDQNISRAELADKLRATPAYVTKVMRGDVNFTLETMTKLALAVGGKLQVRIIDADSVSQTNRVMFHDARSRCEVFAWRSEKMRPLTAASSTRRVELSGADAASQSPYEYEKLGERAA